MRAKELLREYRLRDDFTPAQYGYWITDEGEILNVESRYKHVDVLDERYGRTDEHGNVFGTLELYDKAFEDGWFRVVAPKGSIHEFSIDAKSMNAKSRNAPLALIMGLHEYACYIFRQDKPVNRREVVRSVQAFGRSS